MMKNDDPPLENIQVYLKNGETNQIAFLPDTKSLDDFTKTSVAMANTQGGIIIWGIKGTKPVDVNNPKGRIEQLLQANLSVSPPLITPIPTQHEVDGKTLILTQIPSGLAHIYAYDGHYLHRQNNQNAPLSPHNLRQLMILRSALSFESEIPQGSTLEDIDWEQAEEYTKNLKGFQQTDTKQILQQRGCLTSQGDELRPTNAGILLFGKNPQQFIPNSDISAVRFASETMSDTFTRQDITGTLPNQIRRAETFLIDHLRKAVHLKDTMERQETFEYPMEAARELVVNAVAHRDYSIQGDNIHLFIYSQRMEVESPGRLAGHMTVDNLKDERFSRNPIIVQVLSDMGFIERLGYGVDRVIELMTQQKLDAPQFKERDGGFCVVMVNRNTDDTSITSQLSSPIVQGTYKGIEINSRQESALNYLFQPDQTRITNKDLKSMFPDVHPETIRRDLVDLVNKNILLKMGQKRGSYYVLKQEPETAEVPTS